MSGHGSGTFVDLIINNSHKTTLTAAFSSIHVSLATRALLAVTSDLLSPLFRVAPVRPEVSEHGVGVVMGVAVFTSPALL
jgi:hypothetical protein